jgi:hypothetical protein
VAAVPADGWQQADTTGVPVKHPSRVRRADGWPSTRRRARRTGRWSSSRTDPRSPSPTTPRSPTRSGSRPARPNGSTTCSSSAPVRPAWLRRSTARRRGCGRRSSRSRRQAGRPVPRPGSRITLASRPGSAAATSPAARSPRPAASAPSCSRPARPSGCATRTVTAFAPWRTAAS